MTAPAAPSTAVQAKAAAYLLEQRVRVLHADMAAFAARVHGSAATPYTVSCLTGGGWLCSCPASTTCTHIVACQAIWAPAEASAAERAESADRGRAAFDRIGRS